MNAFRYELGHIVQIKASGERGEVIGCAKFSSSQDQYQVRYKAADGNAVEVWWTQSALEEV